ncbi:MAG: hypothetical protein Kow0088_11530 [Anaerolineales bacterium]
MTAIEEAASLVEIVSPFAEQIIQHILHQGNRNDCAPFTAATLIHTFTDQRIDPIALAHEMNRIVWRHGLPRIRRLPNWATFPWGVVDILQQYGLSARWQFLQSLPEMLNRLSTPIIYLPIILSWRPLWAHILTLVAYRAGRGFGFANTQLPYQKIDWIAEDRFLKLWQASLRCTVIVTPTITHSTT